MKQDGDENMLRDALRLIGKYILRLSEYCFGGVLLAELVNTGDRNSEVLKFGLIVTPLMALLGLILFCLSYKVK